MSAHDFISAHLRACEEALLDPAVRRDRARVAALLAENFQEFGSSGKVWSRDRILDVLTSEDYHPPKMEDFRCERIGEGVALVTYRTVRTETQTGRTEAQAGKSTAVLRSSIWIEQSGEWRVRFHQGTKAP